MNLKDWMECANYRITEGSNFCWQCFGPNAYTLTSWDGRHDGYSLNIVFDTDTQEVYVVEACDYSKDRAYRFINPAFEENHNKEMKNRKIDNTAWDDVNWIDLAVYEDWKEKTMAIVAGKDYDTRVQIPLDLEEDEIFKLMCMAHERDITLNEFVVEILTNVIESNK
jgi:hypothetical protein